MTQHFGYQNTTVICSSSHTKSTFNATLALLDIRNVFPRVHFSSEQTKTFLVRRKTQLQQKLLHFTTPSPTYILEDPEPHDALGELEGQNYPMTAIFSAYHPLTTQIEGDKDDVA